MSTELQKQLTQLKKNQLQVEPIQKGRPSLFLTPKEAAGIDIESIYDVAASALSILEQYDSRFGDYRNNVLNSSSTETRRELNTQNEDEEIRLQINSLLKLLCIFIDKIQSHQIIEYLIRRYHIHELNIDDYITTFLPVHESKIFARAIQIVQIPRNSKWMFLEGVKITGSPLPLLLLTNECIKNTDIFNALCTLTLSSIYIAHQQKRCNAYINQGIERSISLLSTIIVHMTDAKVYHNQSTLNDSRFRILCHYIFPGLSSYIKHYPESEISSKTYATQSIYNASSTIGHIDVLWRKSCYIILSRVSATTKFSNMFINYLTDSLLHIIGKSMDYEMMNGFGLIDNMNIDREDMNNEISYNYYSSDIQSSVYFEVTHVLCQLSAYQKLNFSMKSLSYILINKNKINLLVNTLIYLNQLNVSTSQFSESLVLSIMKIMKFYLSKSMSNTTTDSVDFVTEAVGDEMEIAEKDLLQILKNIPFVIHMFILKGIISQSILEQILKQLLIWLTFINSNHKEDVVDSSDGKKKTKQKNITKSKSKEMTSAFVDSLITVTTVINSCNEILLKYSQQDPILFDQVLENIRKTLTEDILYQEAVTQGVRVSLNTVLNQLFESMPYRQPSKSALLDSNSNERQDVGELSLYLSLSATSVQTRLIAIQRYQETVSLPHSIDRNKNTDVGNENNSLSINVTADLKGLTEAVARQMIDTNPTIASAVWNVDIVEKVIAYLPFSVFYETMYEAVNYWLQLALQRHNKVEDDYHSMNIVMNILKCLSDSSILQAFIPINSNVNLNDKAKNSSDKLKIKARDWLLATILYISTFPPDTTTTTTATAITSVAAKPTKKSKKSMSTVAVTSVDTIADSTHTLLSTFLHNYLSLVYSVSYPIYTTNSDIQQSHMDNYNDLAEFCVYTLLPDIKGEKDNSKTEHNMDSSSETLRLLQSFSYMLHNTISNKNKQIHVENELINHIPVILSLFDNILQSLFSHKSTSVLKEKYDISIHVVLTIYLPTLLRLLHSHIIMNDKLQPLIVQSFSNLFNLYILQPSPLHVPVTSSVGKSSIKNNESSEHISIISFLDIFNVTLSPIYANDLSMRVLVGLLSCSVMDKLPQDDIQNLISLCLDAFFKVQTSHVPLALLQILTVTSTTNAHTNKSQLSEIPFVSFDDSQPFVSKELLSLYTNHSLSSEETPVVLLSISDNTRAGALNALCAWVDSLSVLLSSTASSTIKNMTNIISPFRNLLLTLPLIVVTCVTDKNIQIRKMAIRLCILLKKLWSDTNIGQVLKKDNHSNNHHNNDDDSTWDLPIIPGMSDKIYALQQMENNQIDNHHHHHKSITRDVIIHLLIHILSAEDLIVSDALSAQAYLSSTLFSSTSTSTSTVSISKTQLSTQMYLLHMATYFASTHDVQLIENAIHYKHIYTQIVHHGHHMKLPSNNYYLSLAIFTCLNSLEANISFSYVWPYIYTILSDTCANIIDGSMHSVGEMTVVFYTLLIDLLSQLKSDTLVLVNKEIMLESICDFVIEIFSLPSHIPSPLTSSSITSHQQILSSSISLLPIIQQRLVSILNTTWIENMSLMTKNRLYNELFSIYYTHLSHKLSSCAITSTATVTHKSALSSHLRHQPNILPFHKILQHFQNLSIENVNEILTNYTDELTKYKTNIHTKYETEMHRIELKYSVQHKQRSDSVSSQPGLDIDDTWEINDEWMLLEEKERDMLLHTYLHAVVTLCQVTGQIIEILLFSYKTSPMLVKNETERKYYMRSLLRMSLQLLNLFNDPMYSNSNSNNNTTQMSTDVNNNFGNLTIESSYDLDYTRTLLCQLACYAFESVSSDPNCQLLFDNENMNNNVITKDDSKKGNKQSKKKATAIETSSVVTVATTTATTVLSKSFTYDELDTNISMILSLLHLSETIQAQSSILALLRHYILYYRSAAHTIVTSLGSLVAQSAMLVTGEENKGKLMLIQDILRTCIATNNNNNNQASDSEHEQDGNNIYTTYQRVLQSLFKYCPDMSTSTRAVLVTVAAETLGASAIPALITVLLAHVYSVGYVPPNYTSVVSRNKNSKNLNVNTNELNTVTSDDDVTILLSAASHRKARKLLLSSLPEEIYRLIVHLTEQLPSVLQTYTIVTLVKQTHFLIYNATHDYISTTTSVMNENSETLNTITEVPDISFINLLDIDNDNDNDEDDNEENKNKLLPTDIRGVMSVGGKEIINYTLNLQQSDQLSDKQVNEDKTSTTTVSATLALLHLQYLADIFDHKLKHIQNTNNTKSKSMKNQRHNVDNSSDIDENDSNQRSIIQSSYLSLVDQMLQLYAYSSTLQHIYSLNRHRVSSLSSSTTNASSLAMVNVPTHIDKLSNDMIYRQIPCGALGTLFSSTCLNTLKSIQHFLEIPTFITIFQELMIHTDPAVRSKAFEMLNIKLDEINIKMNVKDTLNENVLFIDLFSQLRGYLVSLLIDPSSLQIIHKINSNSILSSNKDDTVTVSDLFNNISTVDISSVLTPHQRIMLTQSVLQSLDLLVKHFYKIMVKLKTSHENMRKEWEKMFLNSLIETVSMAQIISTLIRNNNKESSTLQVNVNGKNVDLSKLKPNKILFKSFNFSELNENSVEIAKCVGTLYLFTGTLASALKNKVLPYLSTIVKELLGSFEYHHSKLSIITGTSVANVTVMLLRNIVSALTIVSMEVSSFMHPYLSDILTTILPIYQVLNIQSSDITTERPSGDLNIAMSPLLNDITRDLPKIILQVSPRLAVPILLSVTPALTGEGHTVAYQYTKLLISIFQHVERNHVVAHMSDLCSLAVLCLDYRRVYYDETEQCSETEKSVIDMCIELCIKFTETELKSFLAQLIDWKDMEISSDDEEPDENNTNQSSHQNKKRPLLIVTTTSAFKIDQYARNITIYHFLSKLGDKLKIIFTPLMTLFWDDAASILENYSKQIKDINEYIITTKSYKKDVSQNPSKKKKLKSKKNKKYSIDEDENENDINIDDDDNDQSIHAAKVILQHLALQASYVLDSVALTCIHDEENFVDEQIFEMMMPQLSVIITVREAFPSDESYLSFIQEHVSNACVALTQSTMGSSRDVLWKPLNHKILIACRDSRTIVRLAAVHLLFDMFHEVGEDYLGLLPECLPFVSELMEDDHEGVCRRTHDLVRLIEDMSGEKIDTYLS